MRRWTADEDALVRDSRLTLQQVARRIGRTYLAVAQRATRLGEDATRLHALAEESGEAQASIVRRAVRKLLEREGRST